MAITKLKVVPRKLEVVPKEECIVSDAKIMHDSSAHESTKRRFTLVAYRDGDLIMRHRFKKDEINDFNLKTFFIFKNKDDTDISDDKYNEGHSTENSQNVHIEQDTDPYDENGPCVEMMHGTCRFKDPRYLKMCISFIFREKNISSSGK